MNSYVSDIIRNYYNIELNEHIQIAKNKYDYIFTGCSLIKKKTNLELNKIIMNIIDELKKHNIDAEKLGANVGIYVPNKKLVQYLKEQNINKYEKMNETILIDFSSPNIAKNLHVGHLRSTIIGDTICNLFELFNAKVLRINHIGDFGTHFGMLINYMYLKYPDFKTNTPNIESLHTFYKNAKKLFDENADFKQESLNKVVLLQKGDNDIVNAWNLICNISKKSYNDIYSRLNIKITDVGESFYKDLIPDVIEELKNKNILIEDKGAYVVKNETIKHPLVVVKKDGGYTYGATDITAIKYRLLNLKVKHIYYVVGQAQDKHLEHVFCIAKRAGWLTNQIVKHIPFGLVLDEHGKVMKSRYHDTIPLKSLLDESIIQTEKKIMNNKSSLSKQELNDVIHKVGYGAIKYADLSVKRISDYKFSYEKMLSLKGNTILYLMYSYIRFKSIIKKANIMLDEIKEINLNTIHEKKLCVHILNYKNIINKVKKDFMINNLCQYAYELATLTAKMASNVRCINYKKINNEFTNEIESINTSYLYLCYKVILIMEQIFKILNIKTIDKI